MRIKRYSILWFVIHLWASLDASTPRLESIMTHATISKFPNYVSHGMLHNPHTRENTDYTMSFEHIDNGLIVDVQTKLTTSRLYLDSQFNVISSTFNILNNDLKTKLNYDQRLAKRNAHNEVEFTFISNNKVTRKKGVFYNRNTIDTFSIIPVLQYLCTTDSTLFQADFGVQHMALKVPVLIQKSYASKLNPLLSTYTVPPSVVDQISHYSGSYIVFRLKVKGWQGLIYNHVHFYIFSSLPPHHYIGHWGGPDQTNLFSFATHP